MSIQVVILAAGQGKRMFSTLPKVLHLLAGKPLLEHVVLTAFKVSDNNPLVVHGHQGSVLQETLSNYKVTWVEQKEQLGTGHALQQTLPQLDDDAQVLVLYGDVPLISETTLKKLIETTPPHAIGMLTAEIANPAGYGRIKRDHHHRIIQIVEEKEATNEEEPH